MSKTEFIAEPGKQEVIITHIFDAPKELVYRAFTDPNLTPQWWGPRSTTTVIDKLDVKPGGSWRFVQHDSKGDEYSFRGFYHEVIPYERLTYTFEFEGMPGHILLETIIFEEAGGKTKIIDKSIYQSLEDRDGMVSYGMESGAAESMERLTELLEKMSAKVEG